MTLQRRLPRRFIINCPSRVSGAAAASCTNPIANFARHAFPYESLPTSSHQSVIKKRIIKKNSHLTVIEKDNINDAKFYDLYERYINEKHADGDMYPASRDQYDNFLTNEWGVTRYYCFYSGEDLVAVAVTDELSDCLSAIYTFYDPTLNRQSLGNYAILWQIDHARRQGLDYVYLGYWIKSCRKMAYKSLYRPMEIYLNDQWVKLT